MTTISISNTAGVVLSSASYANPVVIAAGVTIANSGVYAVFGTSEAPAYFVIQNYGTIDGSQAGVNLHVGGSFTNAASGSVKAGTEGVGIRGAAGTVVNDGTMSGGDDVVYLDSGGSVTNAASASITGNNQDIGIRRAVGTLVNDGSITAGNGAVYLYAGGSVTNGASASITGVNQAVAIGGGTGTVINDGSLSSNNVGVILHAGGLFTNAASGLVTGGNFAVDIYTTAGTALNAGDIDGGHVGVFLGSGGSIDNAASASIVGGDYGVEISSVAATVVNQGSIGVSGSFGVGVTVSSDSTVVNAVSGVITGVGYGVRLPDGGTLTNAGMISASTGVAVGFGGTGSNLLVLDPGYRFSGVVEGGSNAANTLELASAASAGAVNGLGTQITNFGPIVFEPGARWSITGDTAGLAGTISGFTFFDTIVVTGVTATGSSFSGGILTLQESGGSATLDLPGSFTMASDFRVVPVDGGTEVTVACFRAGSRIACGDGERAVEFLVVGELVRVVGGGDAEIMWIGYRDVDCSGHPTPAEVWPVRVRAGAFGGGMPRRDLWLSPDHAVFSDDVLIPVRYLINGRTIVQEQVDKVRYYHVELSHHAVILAEGLPCESYLDTGNRSAFAEEGEASNLVYA